MSRQQSLTNSAHYLCAIAICAAVVTYSTAAEPSKEVRRILILNEVNSTYPATTIINQGIEIALNDSPYHLEFYDEYMDTSLFPDPAIQQGFRDSYIRKYQTLKLDVIVTVGPSPLKFMQAVHQRAFPGVPIVFCLPAIGAPGTPKLDSDFTGVENDMAPAETVRIALRLVHGTKNVVVVGGVAPVDKEQLVNIEKELKAYEGHVAISYLTDMAMPDLLERLRNLPSNTVVLLTSVARDTAGLGFKSNESGSMVAGAANAPVFGLFDVYLNHGEVGGYLSNMGEQGKVAGGMALRILKGTNPRDIPYVKGVNTYMFDWRALKRWGLKESALPPGSIILNRQPTVWELYKWYILGGISLILAEALLIFGLVWHRERRRRSERYSRELVLRSPVAMIVTRGPGHKNELVNNKFTELFGYAIEDVPDEDHWWHLAYPDETYREAIKAEWRRRVEKALIERKDIAPLETSVRCKDGSYRHIEFHFAVFDDCHLIKLVDLTDRRRAEIQLRESEERFRLVANTAPVLIWMSGTDKLCTYFNQPWLEFTGRSVETELGNGWSEGVHPEDLVACMDVYTQAFDRRESFQTEYRLRRHDGEYRWVSDTGVPRFNPDHSFAGYIGSCNDVTERKLAEESLADVGRKLIEAHEEERTWIARELHDDVNQRMALLAIELDRWNQQLPPSAVEFHDHIHHAVQRLSDIAKDIQGLSHRLHSSKLDYLGLVVAAKSFCNELSEQQKVEIDFSHTAIPRSVPKEISLCLFRVLQETLQNAVKHSGVRHFKVELCGTEGEIQLTVSDLGIGFDPQEAIHRRGLGLISMRERMQLVSGEFSINSHPGSGTTIHARVPFNSSTDSVRATA